VATIVAGKKKALAAAFIIALMFSTVAASQLVHSGKGEIPAVVGNRNPDVSTKQPVISFSSPINGTTYPIDSVTLSFNVTVGDSSTALSRLFHEVYYIADWQQTKTQVSGPDLFNEGELASNVSPPIIYTAQLTGVPEGKHNITIYAEEWGAYVSSRDAAFLLMWEFSINSSSTIFFNVDTIPPNISILTPLNSTYAPTEVPLNFTVNELPSWTGYSLDGKDNVTVSGNATLPELSTGPHALKLYANDTAGNPAASETAHFSVEAPDPFPTEVAVTISGASLAMAAIGVLVYFKKRKQQH
jgi:hypothetical protein